MPTRRDDELRVLEQIADLLSQNLAATQDLRQEIVSLRESQASVAQGGGAGADGPGGGVGSGAPSQPSPLGETGDGLLDAAGSRLGKFGAAGAALAAGAASAAVGRGIVSGVRGGRAIDAAGGLAAGINDVVARVPVLGELTGAAPAQRIAQGVRGSQGVRALEDLAAAGGGVDDELIDQVVAFESQRERRREEFGQRVDRRLERDQIPVAQGILGGGLRYGTLPGLLGIDVAGGISEGLRSLHMQLNTSGVHTQK